MARLFDPWKSTPDRAEDPHRGACPVDKASVRVRKEVADRPLECAQDEVDDSRTTLGYAVAELKKDIQAQFDKLSDEKKAELPETKLGIFVGAFPLRMHSISVFTRRQTLWEVA